MTRLYKDPFGEPWRFNWIRMMLQWQGGILQMLWIELLIALAVGAGILTGVYFAWQDKDTISPQVKALTDAVTFVSRRFQAAIALMLGFYTIQMFNRRKEVRELEGNAMGTVNDLALQVAWRLRDEVDREGDVEADDDEEEEGESFQQDEKVDTNDKPVIDVVLVRLTLIRWLNLSHALVIGEVYEMERNEFSSLDNLVSYGLATEKECTFLRTQESRYKYVAPFLWFLDLVQDLQKKDLYGVDAGVANTLSVGVVALRRVLADLHGVKSAQIPLSYRQLTHLTVRFYVVLLLLAAVLFEKSDESSYGQLSEGSFWIIMVYAFEYLLFVGWLTVADAVGNPYRAWADQLDWDTYVKSLHLNSLLIASRFRGQAGPPVRMENYDEIIDLEKQELTTCRDCEASFHKVETKAPKTFKEKRKLVTGF